MGVGVVVVVRIVAAPFTPVSPKAGFDSIDGSVLIQSVGRTVEGSLSYSSYHSSCSVESRRASGLPAVGRMDGRKGRWTTVCAFEQGQEEGGRREGRYRRTLARSPSLPSSLSSSTDRPPWRVRRPRFPPPQGKSDLHALPRRRSARSYSGLFTAHTLPSVKGSIGGSAIVAGDFKSPPPPW